MLAPDLYKTRTALPKIVEITDANALATEELDHFPLVGFNLSGRLPPLFAVRTWSEEVENYRLLAEYLGPDQPIYSVSPPTGSQPSDFPADTDEWADLCIERFGSLLDRDSIAFTGWSYAGVVALRVADRLAERGVDVRLVALVDSTLPRRKPKGDSRKRSEAHHFFVMMERMFELENAGARRLYFKRYTKKVLGRIGKRVKRGLKAVRRALRGAPNAVEESGASGPKKSSIRDTRSRERRTPLLMRAIRVAYLKHTAKVMSVPVSLYWSEESRGRVGDASLGWPLFLRGEFECCPVPGTHHTLYEEPHVQTLARRLSQALERAWAEREDRE
jgi:thioesterase domain-containing protein